MQQNESAIILLEVSVYLGILAMAYLTQTATGDFTNDSVVGEVAMLRQQPHRFRFADKPWRVSRNTSNGNAECGHFQE
jgi:hypothetical protein